ALGETEGHEVPGVGHHEVRLARTVLEPLDLDVGGELRPELGGIDQRGQVVPQLAAASPGRAELRLDRAPEPLSGGGGAHPARSPTRAWTGEGGRALCSLSRRSTTCQIEGSRCRYRREKLVFTTNQPKHRAKAATMTSVTD